MTDSLKLSDREIESTDLVKFLAELDLLPSIIKRYIERSVSSQFRPSESDQVVFQKSFLLSEKISSTQDLHRWLDANHISEPQLSKQLFHSLQLKLFKESKFSPQVKTAFLDNKSQLDRVMYSMIRSSERAKINEIHLRIVEEESTFADLATEYSEGVENQFNGLIGPIELGRINVSIAERLRISKPGQLWDPFQLDGWWVLLRLEKSIPSQLDESMTNRIINDLYNIWISKKVKSELDMVVKNNTDIQQLSIPQAVPQSSTFSPDQRLDSSESDSSIFSKLWDKLSSSAQQDT